MVDELSIDEQLVWARDALLADPPPAAGVTAGPNPLDVVFLLVDRLEAMLEHTTDMITVVGADGEIRYSNRAAGALTGHSETVNGSNASELIHPDDREHALRALSSCVKSEGATATAEFRLRHADGSWHYVEAYAKNCLSDPVAGVVVSMRDICARQKGEAALLAANEAMRDFVAIASHELRTPTAIISGFASGLGRHWKAMDDDDRDQAIDAIARSAQRLTNLVEDLLTLSAVDAGVRAEPQGDTDLSAVLREAVAEISEGRTEITVPDGLIVTAARRDLWRALSNLIENALRYGAPPVVVDARIDGASVVVRVRDHGPGIDGDFVPQLFQRFARADTSRSRQTGGTGLGLSIVRALATGWGGEAWFEPAEPTGACFAIRIPIAGAFR